MSKGRERHSARQWLALQDGVARVARAAARCRNCVFRRDGNRSLNLKFVDSRATFYGRPGIITQYQRRPLRSPRGGGAGEKNFSAGNTR